MARALTRRAALAFAGVGAAGIGSTVLFDALGKRNTVDLSPDAISPTDPVDFQGKVKFNSYEGTTSPAIPGTRDAKAQNIPTPKEPEGMNENTLSGLYKFIGYWLAAHNHLLLTGDATIFNKVTDPQDQEDAKEYSWLYSHGAWLRSSNISPFSLSLVTAQPEKDKTRNIYRWKCTPGIDDQAQLVNAKNDILENLKTNFLIDANPLHIIYDKGHWRFTQGLNPEFSVGA